MAASTGAHAGADPAILQMGVGALDTCATHMPDTDAMHGDFQAAGLKSEGGVGGLRAYSQNGRRMIVAFSSPGSQQQFCFVFVRRMTTEEAVAALAPYIELINGTLVEPTPANFDQMWEGDFKGGRVRLGVYTRINILGQHGKALVAAEVN